MGVGERFIVALFLDTRRHYSPAIFAQEWVLWHFQKDLCDVRFFLLLTPSKVDWNLGGSIILAFLKQKFLVETASRNLVVTQ